MPISTRREKLRRRRRRRCGGDARLPAAPEVGDDAPGLDVPVGALDVVEDEGDGDLDGLLARTEILNRKLRRIRGERAAEGSREGRRGLTPTGLLGVEDVDVGVYLGLGHGADRSGIQQEVMVRHR
jgi:hypothetical protein